MLTTHYQRWLYWIRSQIGTQWNGFDDRWCCRLWGWSRTGQAANTRMPRRDQRNATSRSRQNYAKTPSLDIPWNCKIKFKIYTFFKFLVGLRFCKERDQGTTKWQIDSRRQLICSKSSQQIKWRGLGKTKERVHCCLLDGCDTAAAAAVWTLATRSQAGNSGSALIRRGMLAKQGIKKMRKTNEASRKGRCESLAHVFQAEEFAKTWWKTVSNPHTNRLYN